MKRSLKGTNSMLSVLFSIVLALLLAGCGGGGGSAAPAGGGGTTATTTTVSGKVTLSNTVGKPAMQKAAMQKAMMNAPKGKPGSKLYKASSKASVSSNVLKSAVLDKALNATAFSSGTVYLYSADHPEWLYPVSDATTGSDGSYTMTALKNASSNNNDYTDGASIPAGNYTLLAFKAGGFDPILGITTQALVAVQTVVNSFSGTVTVDDLVAAEGTDLPTVSAIIGAKKNTDGTETWGSASTQLPANAAIQVSFSAPMSRGSLTNGISISPSVSGKWSLSADWTTATFYPATGVSLAVNSVYTITVKGSDSNTSANTVKNVYGNALAKTATGTFTAVATDTVAPTAEWESPTVLEMGSAVDVTKPIRIRANKQLDVNTLTLDGQISGVSSLGAKPGVLFVGKNTAGLYVYEFVLGEPLQLGATYTLSVSGGKGLNGIAMIALSGSLVTKSAAATSGVDPTASTTTQQAQAAVKDVLGKWIRAFNDRNITQLKGLMAGDFYFEDTKMDSSDDVNKDGRLSLGEFADMLEVHAFPQWEYCGTTITGDIAVGTTINMVAPLNEVADFEFSMVATSTNTSQQCLDTMPTDSFYATVQKVNGAWTIVRASVGVDTRDKTISFPDLIDNLKLTQNSVVIADGGTIALPTTYPVIHSWDAATGVSSYVLIRMDARNPENGRACALPNTVTSFSPATTTSCVDAGGTGVAGKFDFDTSAMNFLVDGGQYYWEVIGLKSITVSTILSKTPKEILNDISAISTLNSFSVAGVYKEITAQVYVGAAATGTPLTYSVNYDGYDAGSASQATITVTTANAGATSGYMYVSGNYYASYPLAFTGGAATVTIELSKGWNWISVEDGVGLWKGFSISTTGGLLPAVDITLVKDDTAGAPTLTGDAWNYYTATTGATKVTISGTVDLTKLPSVSSVYVNVSGNTSGAYSYTTVPVTPFATYATFSVTVDIYQGDNWISVGANDTSGMVWYNDNIGVYTDTGTVWVPNISITGVTTATSTGSYGSSADYDASTDGDNVVTITGTFKNPVNGNYNISSDGGWSNGTLIVLADGTFSLDVTLYNGWNYVSLSDSNYNWYGVNIYTTAGKTAVKPTILAVDGVAPTVNLGGASAAVTGCTATVTGTAKPGNLYVYWNGFDGVNYNYEYQNLVLTGTPDTAISFSFSVPLVSGSGSYNNIDVYDLNWMWTGVKVTTSGACIYNPPVMTLSSVKNSGGVTIGYDAGLGYYPAGASQTIMVSGTSDRPGRTITLSSYACTSQSYTTTADTSGNWSFTGIPVYDGYNYPSISDGYTSQSLTVYAANAQFAVPTLTASVTGGTLTYTGSCGYKQWDAGTATSVTITGTTTAPDGTGYYTDATGGNHPFTISGGSYTISGVTVYGGGGLGEWNYIYLNDTAWNYQSVSIYSTNTSAKPKFVNIATPVNTNTASFVAGLQGVTGTITDPVASGYAPSVVRAQMGVWNNTTYSYTYTYYSSDVNDQNMYGDSAITYNATTGSYSFQADFGTVGSYTYIHVYAYDDVTYASHGMQMYYNDGTAGSTGYSNYYKPGAKAGGAAPRNPAVASEIMKQQLKSINRNR
ncbi:MAG: Ig-like domain-containing protein [Gallionella sp.]|nr:Ig-like domain-containing protein [Gallionella sp.]